MSTDWRPIPDILFAKLFDGCLEKYGIKKRSWTTRQRV